MRSLLLTIAGVLLVCGAVTTSAWALQTLLLPPPERGDLAALKAVTRLDGYRLVESTVRVNGGPPGRGWCLTGWYPEHGELLQLGRRASILDAGRHRLSIVGGLPGDPVASLLLAGCPRILGPTVERLLQDGSKASTAPAWFERPAVAVGFRERSGVQLTLYLTPKQDVLLGLRLDGPRTVGVSHIHQLRVTPARLALVEGRR